MLNIIPLPTKNYSAGGSDTLPLRDIPKALFGRIVHVVAIVFDVAVTPTFGAGGGATINETNNVVKTLDFWDGTMSRHQGGFSILRLREYLAGGRLRNPDPDTDTASGTARYFRRILHVGPAHLAGGLDNGGTDFALPAGILENAEIRLTYGALADVGTGITACTATIRPYAVVQLLDEVRIPPAYQFGFQTVNASDVSLTGRAVYESLTMCDSAALGAIGAGDFGTVTLDMGYGDIVPGVPTSALSALYADTYRHGSVLPGISGEPLAASDDNAKAVNSATPTALTAAAAIAQPVIFQGAQGKLSKLYRADSVTRLRWTGTQASALLLHGRILAQPPAVAGALAAKALGSLGKSRQTVKVKTLSKREYTGPLGEFMPLTVKVA